MQNFTYLDKGFRYKVQFQWRLLHILHHHVQVQDCHRPEFWYFLHPRMKLGSRSIDSNRPSLHQLYRDKGIISYFGVTL